MTGKGDTIIKADGPEWVDVKMMKAMASPEPPRWCPMCNRRALNPSKDEKGFWTWECAEGCNP